jgi:hypothetical protein
MIKKCTDMLVKYQLFLSDFNENWILLTDFGKILIISTFIKIGLVEKQLFPEDGQTHTRTDRQT